MSDNTLYENPENPEKRRKFNEKRLVITKAELAKIDGLLDEHATALSNTNRIIEQIKHSNYIKELQDVKLLLEKDINDMTNNPDKKLIGGKKNKINRSKKTKQSKRMGGKKNKIYRSRKMKR